MAGPKKAFTVQSHFEGREPAVRGIYEALLKAIRRIGPVSEEPKKTSIHLVNATALAGVATRRNHLILTIKSDHPLSGARIHKSEQASARRFHHEIKLTSPDQVDAELVGWLIEAYALSA